MALLRVGLMRLTAVSLQRHQAHSDQRNAKL